MKTTIRVASAAVSALVLSLAILPSAANARPTFRDARNAVHTALDSYTEASGGKLIIGACARRGTKSVVCRARIDGPLAARYRVIVSGWYYDHKGPFLSAQLRLQKD